MPPSPLRSGFVVALGIVAAVCRIPFGVGVLFEQGPDVSIELESRLCLFLAILVAPTIAVVAGRRRGVATGVAISRASVLAAGSCIAGLFAVSSTIGVVQAAITGAICGASLHLALAIGKARESHGTGSQTSLPRRPDHV